MASTKGVVLALLDAREATDSTHLTIGWEEVTTTCDDLVGISLMAHVPHQLIVGGVIDVVKRNGELHHTKTRSQVTRVFRALLDDVLSKLVTIHLKLLDREALKIGRRVYLAKEFVFGLLDLIHVTKLANFIK